MIYVPRVRQETSYSCGAAALLAVLRYWKAFDGEERDLHAPLGTTHADGTPAENIARMARLCGLSAEFVQIDFDRLEQELEAEAPVILAVQAWAKGHIDYREECGAGHYVVLTGMDATNAYFMDPAMEGGYAFIPLDALRARWHDVEGGECVSNMAITIRGADHLRGQPEPDAIKLSEMVVFDQTPYRNVRLVDAAKLLAGAVKARPLNRTLIAKLIGRLIGGLEAAVIGVEGRADADRFSHMIRNSLSDLVSELEPVLRTTESQSLKGVPLALAELRAVHAHLCKSLHELGGSSADPPKKAVLALAQEFGGEIDSLDTRTSGELPVKFKKSWDAWRFIQKLAHAWAAVGEKLRKPDASITLPSGVILFVPVKEMTPA